jgi:hypothetical protein
MLESCDAEKHQMVLKLFECWGMSDDAGIMQCREMSDIYSIYLRLDRRGFAVSDSDFVHADAKVLQYLSNPPQAMNSIAIISSLTIGPHGPAIP